MSAPLLRLLPAFLLAACATRPVEAPAPPSNDAAVQHPFSPKLEPEPYPFGPQRSVETPPDPVVPGVDGKASVALGPPTVSWGELGSTTGFGDEVARNAGHLQRCWNARASDAPQPTGEIVIHANIDPTGTVTEQCITTDTIGDPALVQCVNELIAMGRYPTGHAETVDIVFPLAFSPPQG
ncbi:MAG: AgmX/PglI C-terminal domain-containing protein [Alphaproteobacteria bacterium]|nr:AgmX/PglI C-terminal domain-containing protein [Alphaproteobacteria bacterium]